MNLHTTFKVSFFAFLFLLIPHFASAMTEDFKSQFCERAAVRGQAESLGFSDNRLSFTNAGGAFNGGVCWWHSRLQRSAAYLAVYRPDLSAPTQSKQVVKLLRSLRSLNAVVQIPGYANFNEFSKKWKNTIQKFLNRWQVQDAVLYGAWIDGLAGSPRGDAVRLQNLMMKLKSLVMDQKNVAYLKLQLKGISAHAWLVYGVEEVANGLRLQIIDSNYLNPVEYIYHWNDPSVSTSNYGNFMPYLENSSDINRINIATANFCS